MKMNGKIKFDNYGGYKMRSFDELWDEIEKNFKWQYVYNAMKALDLQWSFVGNRSGIPSINTLKSEGKRLAGEAYMRGISIGTGGLMATCTGSVLILEFTLSHWEAK